MAEEALVGWHPDSEQAALAFPAPRIIDDAPPGLAGRLVEIPCAFDVTVRISQPGIRPVTYSRVEAESTLSEGAFRGLFEPLLATSQRAADLPVLQLSLNYLFVTEEPSALMLMPPFLAPQYRAWPGTLVSGRFPPRAWPRVLNAALEWADRDRDWVLRRGDPLAYLWFAFDNPAKRLRLVEADWTPALARHHRQTSTVVSYGRNVGPMFEEAERRRPARLLTPKATGAPPWR